MTRGLCVVTKSKDGSPYLLQGLVDSDAALEMLGVEGGPHLDPLKVRMATFIAKETARNRANTKRRARPIKVRSRVCGRKLSPHSVRFSRNKRGATEDAEIREIGKYRSKRSEKSF
jgi:hypothetical protein